ncbi:MAG: glucosidase [Akkermansiaceae bacterium]|nr:glucosidase [Akkermansiaceae bacterium]NNM28647.1 glucosidase [Akkermansiaceae bacterium]
MEQTTEGRRLAETTSGARKWKFWGPYLSERQWGTVREDYSEAGDAWGHFPHDHARSRAYRWGEDGLGGFADHHARLCLSVALWNGHDSILKERLYGLTNREGSHGEDVKEIYYYQDATPTHSYCKMLYKYPHAAFPYEELLENDKKRGKRDPEYEIWDTGVFDEDRYFDVTIEYAKSTDEDVLMRITVENRGPEAREIHVLPQAWFRNTWSPGKTPRPSLRKVSPATVRVDHPQLDPCELFFDGDPELLFCENDTNPFRHPGEMSGGDFFKDGIHGRVVEGKQEAVNTLGEGTKVAGHYTFTLRPSERRIVRLWMSPKPPAVDFDAVFAERIAEADEFYGALQAEIAGAEVRDVQRQALAGMIWSKQYYHLDVEEWLNGDLSHPNPPPSRHNIRNHDWLHLNNADIISMPDAWEYPWYAAWDLAFHCLPLALVDSDFAKGQLELMLRVWYLHPNGQIPAYEWNFSDVNPPVHAWACWRVYQMERRRTGQGDLDFLERIFHKLVLNFTWWVNRKDDEGRNLFQGGFLGLDNIGLFDRSHPLPNGGHIHQSDGTAWMAMYSLNLMRIALELSTRNSNYEPMATKFFEHFLYIAHAMTDMAEEGLGLWDDEDKFYYDVLHLPDDRHVPLKVRSMVGLIPLFAVEVLEPEFLKKVPRFAERLRWLMEHKPELANLVSHWHVPGAGDRRLLSLLRGHRMKCLLRRMLDETEFLSDYGVRGLSKYHAEHPYFLHDGGIDVGVGYVPAESDSNMFGGNSNWRGPIWFPVNFLLIESLQRFHHYYGDDFKVECPVGSGRMMTIREVADELARRLVKIFLPDEDGRRPVYGHAPLLRDTPGFREHLLFYEYFHGDNGRGVGASHQTGWTGLVAKLIDALRAEF